MSRFLISRCNQVLVALDGVGEVSISHVLNRLGEFLLWRVGVRDGMRTNEAST